MIVLVTLFTYLLAEDASAAIQFKRFSWGPNLMTVKIDGVEPNIFPDVEDLDARDEGRNVEVFLDIRVEGKPTPVTVKLSYEQASDLAALLEPFRKR